ncbi:Malonyl-CoA:anthocyanidin 5-O-glucoside-6''-O-malonyltransferase [Citrus sinensis]|uniref:Malonyl-CoA:anthocyanidin 5-O-glucoside-6''-O-malonyltransferase n=1 Tax=Citrus sinensis TaxID=2711 RepID=A0ACB8HUL1_CITSI|nr:Malonyl-CoA:anthocyanidin 5-O-glucoside-6''-O-malonyltransferase [Citrus sinensis]
MAETKNNSKVKVHEDTKLTPFSSNSTTAAPFTLPLTYFDTYWFKFPPVERLFLYQITELTSDSFNSAILPKLKHALSLTLLHYTPLAGHLMWPPDAAKPAIYYFPDDGVSLTVAESNSDFALLSGSGIRDAAEFNPLVPQLSISDDKTEAHRLSAHRLSAHRLSAHGLSAHGSSAHGLSAHGSSAHRLSAHGSSAHGDLRSDQLIWISASTSCMMFIKSWAYFSKQIQSSDVHNANPSLAPELTPCFDRTVIKDPDGIDMVYVKHWMDFTGSSDTRSLKVLATAVDKEGSSDFVRKTFELSGEDIKKLRDKVNKINNEAGESKQLHLSTFVLTCAHAYVCQIRAKRVEANTTVEFAVGGDCRGRLDPPVPTNYFGNCIGSVIAEAKASDMIRDDGVAVVAEKLSEMIKVLKGNGVQGSEDKMVKTIAMLKEKGHVMLTAAGSNRFDDYGSDFGWGRPKKVEIVSVDRTGAISLVESKDGGGGGVEIGVVLKKQQMEVFASLFVNGLEDL